jgi:hypothetical protein
MANCCEHGNETYGLKISSMTVNVYKFLRMTVPCNIILDMSIVWET